MTKEIGSEFWDVPVCEQENAIFPDGTKWFLAGRTALAYIIQDCEIKSVAMPKWCCSSMIAPFEKSGVEVCFYDSFPDQDKDCIFLMDYFGFHQGITVPSSYKGIVIRDVTHSIFSRNYDDADYYFGSLRKWAGFWTGGFAWGNWKKELQIPSADQHYVELRKTAMEQKKKYIFGDIDNKDYLKIYAEASEYLDSCEICSADEADIYAAKHLDVNTIIKKRRENALTLLQSVNGLFSLEENDCPLFVPIKVNDRDELRNYLIEKDIYCPVHWPEYDLDSQELSLVCDQRYDINDMNRICDAIKKYYSNRR